MALLYSQRCLRKGTSTGSRLELQPTVAHHALAAIEDKGLIGKLDLNRAILAKRMEVSDGKKRCLHMFKSTVALPSKARSCLFDVLFCIPEETLGVTTLPQVVNFSRVIQLGSGISILAELGLLWYLRESRFQLAIPDVSRNWVQQNHDRLAQKAGASPIILQKFTGPTEIWRISGVASI